MKILFVDASIKGHRDKYIKALVSGEWDSVLLIPEKLQDVQCKQYALKESLEKSHTIFVYKKFISEIAYVANKEKVDIVHFLNGDVIYRFFGLYLKKIKQPIFITYHHVVCSFLKNISMKRIYKRSAYGIVHTMHIKQQLNKIGIENVHQVDYPVLSQEIQISNMDAKKRIGIPTDKKCISVMGMTGRYKGTDILISALKKVKEPFFLYITRAGGEFNKDYILENTKEFSDSVLCNESKLSEDDYSLALAATDIIALPYRYEFDGASGPMVEGVWNRKYIIGSEHGSLGSLINQYELGSTFKTEDEDDLARVLACVLNGELKWNAKSEEFRNQLTVSHFLNTYKQLYNEVICLR